jgi:hypothetical protein
MKIRDQLICRIIEDRLIVDDIIRNYQLIELSGMMQCPNCGMGVFINALPDSIMRNWRKLSDEFDIPIHEHKKRMTDIAYQFDYSTNTDYKLSKGFIDWLKGEHKKIRGLNGRR